MPVGTDARRGSPRAPLGWRLDAPSPPRPRARLEREPRPGVRLLRVRARAAHGARGRGDRPLRGRDRPEDRARPAQPGRPRVRPARRARRLHLPHPLGDPAQRGPRVERRGVRRGADGRRPPLRARRRRPRPGHRARRPPRQRRGRAARRVRRLRRRRRRRASIRPPASRRSSSCRARAVRTKTARAALPAEVPMADAVFNTAHGALLVLGLARGDWDLVARGLRGPPAPAPPRAPLPALDGARPRRALVRRARGDDLGRRPDRARVVPLRDHRGRRRGPAPRGRGLGRRSCGCPSSPRAPTCASSERRASSTTAAAWARRAVGGAGRRQRSAPAQHRPRPTASR